MSYRSSASVLLVALACWLISFDADAQLAVSANDGKAILVDGAASVAPSPSPDYVSIIDLSVSPPKVIGEVRAPVSVVGPPQSVDVSRDESIALVTGAMKLNPTDPTKTIPDDKLTVIDLKASPPAVIATVQAGAGASGVSMNARFYHVDTAFCPLPRGEVLYVPGAFTAKGRSEIRERVTLEERIELGIEDAVQLAANAVCLGDTIVLSGCSGRLRAELE